MSTSIMGKSSKPFSILENLNMINIVDGVLKVPCTKITEEVGISIRSLIKC
jgi:hypothetical protein